MAGKRSPNRIETLPSGIEVAYWDAIGVDGQKQERRYRVGGVDGERYPSISTIAGSFDKPMLTPAAVKLQEEGVIALAQSGVDIASLTREQLRAKLWDTGLHYDAVWKLARERGDIAHDMLLALVRDGLVPRLGDYDVDLQPWIRAGMKFVLHWEPEILVAEYFVVSVIHKFAGRGDLLCQLRDGRVARIDYKTVTRWHYERDRAGNLKLDEDNQPIKLKPWAENLIALAGYDIAGAESRPDLPEADVQLIVRLGPDGEYDVAESHATPEVFLAALTAYREKNYLSTGRPEAVIA